MGRGLPEKKPLPGVKSIILVASGKGGVGKTTTAVNLACAMKVIEPDKEIGLLDADVFGPSVPLMMNISGEPMLNDDNLIEPLLNYGRGINMFEKLKVPIIGLVENMSHAICYKCGSVNYIFGSETVKAAAEMGLDIIESFAVDQNMSECINSGKPAIYALPDSIHAEKYRHLANKVFKYIEHKDKERHEAQE
ncbi:Nucleotide-binding protein-like protein [Operophtera brumata]|uniref:Nucleotide-binding protein-like protein n=1 Tax=Operophtera brumata TaxID=104452 RepID=A0A0L7KXZ5_OPEBR|nr:Nucleotide-binding protein-like protein [Operophtera brumata]